MSKSVRYLIFTFALSWTIQIIGCRDLHLESVGGLLSFSQALAWCMLVPALGAFLAGADIAGMGWKPDFRASIRPLLFAWLAPTLFQLAGAALYFLVFPGDFDLTGTYLKEVHPGRFAELQKTGFSAMDYLLKEICTSLFSYRIVISVILGLGEEIGWRGFLYPELDTYFGKTKAMLLRNGLYRRSAARNDRILRLYRDDRHHRIPSLRKNAEHLAAGIFSRSRQYDIQSVYPDKHRIHCIFGIRAGGYRADFRHPGSSIRRCHPPAGPPARAAGVCRVPEGCPD